MNRLIAAAAAVGLLAGCSLLGRSGPTKPQGKVPLVAPFAGGVAPVPAEPPFYPRAINPEDGLEITLPNDGWRAKKNVPFPGAAEYFDVRIISLYAYNRRKSSEVRIFIAPKQVGTPAFIALRTADLIKARLETAAIKSDMDGDRVYFVQKSELETMLTLVHRMKRGGEPVTLVVYAFWPNNLDAAMQKEVFSIVNSLKTIEPAQPEEPK